MAEVYLARQKGLVGFEKLVVLKRILPNLAEQPGFVQMFLDDSPKLLNAVASAVEPFDAAVGTPGGDGGSRVPSRVENLWARCAVFDERTATTCGQ